MTSPLLAGFAAHHPLAAAHSLERYEPKDIAAFLTQLPPSLRCKVLGLLSSQTLKHALDELPASGVGDMIAEAEVVDAYAVIAHLPADRYKAVITSAAESNETKLRNLFGLSGQTVAMQTTTDFLRVRQTETCGQIKALIETTDLPNDLPVFVVSDDHKYVGIIPVFRLLAKHNHAQPASVVCIKVPAIIGDAGIHSALGLAEWTDYPTLPVVDAANVLLGSVSLRQLRKVASRGQPDEPGTSAQGLIDSYLDLCADILQFVLVRRK